MPILGLLDCTSFSFVLIARPGPTALDYISYANYDMMYELNMIIHREMINTFCWCASDSSIVYERHVFDSFVRGLWCTAVSSCKDAALRAIDIFRGCYLFDVRWPPVVSRLVVKTTNYDQNITVNFISLWSRLYNLHQMQQMENAHNDDAQRCFSWWLKWKTEHMNEDDATIWPAASPRGRLK